MSALNKKCLVLNSDFRPLATYPLSLITGQEAVKAVYRGRAMVVEEWSEVFHSPSVEIYVPRVIALRQYAPISAEPKFCRRSILLRDHFKCFAAGTMVLMANGRQSPIEDVVVGDRVIDAFGVPVSVTRVGNRVADDCVSIKHRGSFERTVVTQDHPYLLEYSGFVSIGDIEIKERVGGGRTGGYLCFPRHVQYELAEPKIVNLSSYLPEDRWFRARGGRIYASRHGHASGMPVTVQQTPELAYLLGLFVAEGSATDTGQITFSFCDDEEHTLAADAARLIGEIFGLNTWTHVHPDRHTCIVGGASVTLSLVLRRLCGKGARNKKVPWGLVGPYHSDFLRGLFLGDAHIDNTRKKVALTMTGFDAVRGAQSMLWGLGIYPTLQHLTLPGKQPILTIVLNAENRSKFMRLVLNQEADDGEPVFGNETHVYRRLQERTPVEGDVVVYNIETDGSHSYIANGLSVHNCQYCGEKFDSQDLTFDHVIPRSSGGTTVWTNILTACVPCNTAKRSQPANWSGQKGKGLRPLKAPRRPTTMELLRAGLEFIDPEVKESWHSWLYWSADLKA